MAIDKIKRNFLWLRKVFGIIEKTTLPGEVLGEVRPTIDTFGWDRLTVSGLSNIETVTGTLASDTVVLEVVPDRVFRYVIYASCSHNDPAGLALNFQVRGSGRDIGLDNQIATAVIPQPMRFGLQRSILLVPGEQLICRSSPAPAAGTSLFLRYKFVDLDAGEYIPSL